MRNFIWARQLWVSIIIGLVRGIRTGVNRIKMADEFESFVGKAARPNGVTHIDDIPIEEHPDYIAVIKARDEIVKRIRAGKNYKDIGDVYADFETEIQFQGIIAFEV